MPKRGLHIAIERFPIAGRFVISRGAKAEAVVVVVTLKEGDFRGRGECVPYARYGESIESVIAQIEGWRSPIDDGAGRDDLQKALPAGAARNALDCAFWDLEAKRSGVRAFERAGLAAPPPVITAYTLSLDTPEAMAMAAKSAARPLLKLKLGGDGDVQRPCRHSRRRSGRRTHRRCQRSLVAGKSRGQSRRLRNARDSADRTAAARRVRRHPRRHPALRSILRRRKPARPQPRSRRPARRYDAINIKLDKAGGLTEALALADEARSSASKL